MLRLISLALCSALCLACQDGCSDRDAPMQRAGGATATASSSRPPRVVLLMYVVGGHLEDSVLVRGEWGSDEGYEENAEPSPFGAASDDLRELVRGLGALERTKQESLHGWVAFGGARKQGWQGMRVADLACLSADDEDGLFGNADCYALADAEANMMKPETLAPVLSRVSGAPPPGSQAPLRVLVLWGQGGGFRGLFHDSKREMPFTKLPELGQALHTAGATFDLAILDASMMATVEVAQTLAPFVRYLVASVDTIPAHGFDYRALISQLASEKPALDIARNVAQRYLDGSSLVLDRSDRKLRELPHDKTSGKTVSVLDLTQTKELLAGVEGFSKVAEKNLPALGSALARAPSYGRNRPLNSLYTIDLEALLNEVEPLDSGFSKSADRLIASVGDMVRFVQGDGTKPASGGLSLFSPLAGVSWPGYEHADVAPPGWLALSEAYATLREQDRNAPALLRRGATKRAPEFDVKDASGVLSAESWHVVFEEGSPSFRIFRVNPIPRPKGGSSAGVSPEPWDGRGHFLCSGPCTKDNRTPIPGYFEGRLNDGSTLYSTSVVVRDIERESEGEDGVFFFRALPEKPISDAWIVHTETDTNGEVLFFRDHYRLEQGLAVAFHVLDYDSTRGQAKSSVTDFFELRAPPHYEVGPLAHEPDRLGRALAVRDLAGNLAVSELVPPDVAR